MSAFDEFETDGEAALQRWVVERKAEHDFLEFKSGALLDGTVLARDAKRQLGEELSGLANSGGGTLVWGVGTAKADGLDVADRLEPVDDIERTLAVLTAQVENLVSPQITGLRIAMTRFASARNKGAIALSVPRSEQRPHMCTAPGKHTYFKKVGTSTMPMSSFEVEDQLLRVRRADMVAQVQLSQGMQAGLIREIMAVVLIKNVSSISALNSYVSMATKGLRYKEAMTQASGFREGTRVPSGRTFYAEPHLVVPPSGVTSVCAYAFYLGEDADGEVKQFDWDNRQIPISGPISMEFSYGCRDAPAKQFEWRLTAEQKEDLFSGQKLLIT